MCRNVFQKYSSTLRDTAFFHSLVNISRKTDYIFLKILLQMYLWTRKSIRNFVSHPDRSGLQILTAFALVLAESE